MFCSGATGRNHTCAERQRRVSWGRTGERFPKRQRRRYDALLPAEGSVVQPQSAQVFPHLRTNRSSSFLECSAEDTHSPATRDTRGSQTPVFAGPRMAVEGDLETRRGRGAWRIGRCTQGKGARGYLQWLQPSVPTHLCIFFPKKSATTMLQEISEFLNIGI